LGFQAAAVINREYFGMTFNLEREHRGLMGGGQVHLSLKAALDLAGD
jgi:hypothetical protein